MLPAPHVFTARCLAGNSIIVTKCLASWSPLHIAAVGTAWSLLGSPRHGHTALCLFQKHLLWITLIAALTLRVFEMDRKCLVIFAQRFPSYQRLSLSTRQNEPVMWSLLHLCTCKARPVLDAFVMRHHVATERTFVKFITLIVKKASRFLSMTNASVYTKKKYIYTVTK